MWTEDEPSFEGTYFRIAGASAPPLPNPVPRVCIGASGEQIGLPMVGRLADMWNGWYRGSDDWARRKGIVHASAEKAGRDPGTIEISTTIEKALPESDADSEVLLDLLRRRYDAGVRHFVMDFGHPLSTEPVLRFVEQVIAPFRAG
jgi:alkanesulfonate monooxygenase SsuD/methylene tetrahydromethanopterin reductase-like flavin-dependent oxidoreductase (luciferase family)